MGIDAFKDSVDDLLHEKDVDKTHLIPLSSGLDSRAILAVLCDRTDIEKSNIQTVSFGSPGTWDFEIGQRVARVAGVSNTGIDLTDESFDWSIESLRKHASGRDVPGRVIDSYVNSVVSTVVDDDFVVWSGFMGDPTAGGHLPKNPRMNWEDACNYFVKSQQYCQGMTHPEFNPRSVLPDEPLVSQEELYYEEQLDFALRQQCLIAPIVIHSNRYRTPFMQPTWLSFALNLPDELRQNRKLFKDAFSREFPELFSLPTDANSGLPLSASPARRWLRQKRLGLHKRITKYAGFEYCSPGTNYIDFATVLRKEHKLRDTMYTLISEFSERDVVDWINPHSVWEEHQKGRDRSKAIRTMASLELFLIERNI